MKILPARSHSTSLSQVRRPLRYGDQSTRSSNIQLLLGIPI